jgi:hypothetical protein
MTQTVFIHLPVSMKAKITTHVEVCTLARIATVCNPPPHTHTLFSVIQTSRELTLWRGRKRGFSTCALLSNVCDILGEEKTDHIATVVLEEWFITVQSSCSASRQFYSGLCFM